ncbi:hypothetical protein diail_8318 [Diaporthe ilicicola]|nr:hypothetical protein diail_8318 [Diaporthe ilicicola]
MSWLGVTPLKKFPAPVRKSIALNPRRLEAGSLLTNPQSSRWPPSSPLVQAGLVIAYGVNAAQNASMKSIAFAYILHAGDEFKNDPRNPLAKSGGAH